MSPGGCAEASKVIETDLTNARNLSAVVSSRIATAKSWEAERFGVEQYIERHGVYEDAANTLRACSGEIQQQVVASDLSNDRNPSAVLLARIRNLESQVAPRYPEVSGRTFRQILSSLSDELTFLSNSVVSDSRGTSSELYG